MYRILEISDVFLLSIQMISLKSILSFLLTEIFLCLPMYVIVEGENFESAVTIWQ